MSDVASRDVLVMGLGNPLMADDGLGIAAVQRLRRGWLLPSSVRLMDAGTWGMNLLPVIEEGSALLLIDAINRGEAPGSLILLEREEVPRFLGLKLSPHQIGLSEVLALAELRGRLPSAIALMGLQPERVEIFAGLSPAVENGMAALLDAVVERLERWGHIAPRAEPAACA